MSDRSTASEGTYTIIVRLASDASLEIGVLGERTVEQGWYAYTGSAFGPGGFGRIERHRAVAAGENDTRHWHVDHLLVHPAASIEGAVRTAGIDAECAVARSIPGGVIEGFGCTDCGCRTHLARAERPTALLDAVRAAHEAANRSVDANGRS